MGGNPYDEVSKGNDTIKGISEVFKKINTTSTSEDYSNGDVNGNYNGYDNGKISEIEEFSNSVTKFKVANTNLPAKPSFWTKVKNVLFYEIKVELTPYQQKIENEINEFLHQPITWKSLKEAALSEVPITFRGKRIF